jgi:ribosome maturation factor RimP
MRQVERTVEGLGYELVDIERAGGGVLRVTLDAPDRPGGIGLDDCERVSRQLAHLLAVESVDYNRLEVSSPGLDRRLSRPRDFVRFAGQRVEVRLAEPLGGRRRLQGRLLGLTGAEGAEQVRLELGGTAPASRGPRPGPGGRAAKRARAAQAVEVVEVALVAIERARLVPDVSFGSRR